MAWGHGESYDDAAVARERFEAIGDCEKMFDAQDLGENMGDGDASGSGSCGPSQRTPVARLIEGSLKAAVGRLKSGTMSVRSAASQTFAAPCCRLI